MHQQNAQFDLNNINRLLPVQDPPFRRILARGRLAEVEPGMAQDKRQPETADEIQARTTLLAAREVAQAIEAVRTRLKDASLSRATRAKLKNNLLEAAERLVNLLELLASRLDRLSKPHQEILGAGIAELRGRLLSTGLRLVDDKVERIRERAVGVTERGEEYSLGLSVRLMEALSEVEATVAALGGKTQLPEKLGGKLMETERAVVGLTDLERVHGMLRDVEGEP